MLIAREEWDDRLDFYRPCGVSKTWDTDDHPIKWPHTLGEYMTKHLLPNEKTPTNDLEKFVHKDFENAIYIDKEELIGKTKYLYVINVYQPLFFKYNNDAGFDYIDERILEDIRKGNCKLIITQDVEGYSGVENSGNEFDFKIIHDWAVKKGIEPREVVYINGNMISEKVAKAQNSDITVIPVTVQEAWNNVFETHKIPDDIIKYDPVDSEYLYLNYNRVPRTHRDYFNASLIRDNLYHLGKNSFNTNLGIYHERLINEIDPHIMPWVKELYNRGPKLIDVDNSDNVVTVTVPLDNYTSTFVNVVSETLYSNNTLFFSEKTWKPIIVGSPFIYISSPGALQYLKDNGFKTFDKWWDESYDNEKDYRKRFDKIVNILKVLSEKPIKELIQMRKEMEEVCYHNKEVIKVRTKDKFYNSKGEYIHHKPTSDAVNKIWVEFTNPLI